MNGKRPSILVVEDELIVAENLRLVLNGMGYDVPATAGTSEEALDQSCACNPDLILMDIVLEGSPMDGIETAKKIRNDREVPVIFVTAFSDDKTLERVKSTQPHAYILKPFNDRELHSAIELALYRHRVEQEIKKRDNILFSVCFAFEWFLRKRNSIPADDPRYLSNMKSGIADIIEQIGLAVHTTCVAIFCVDSKQPGAYGAKLEYVWVDPYISVQGKMSLTNSSPVSFTSHVWRSLLMSGNAITGGIDQVGGDQQKFFRDRGIASIAILPLFKNDQHYGFIGFFDATPRSWSGNEIEALRIAGNLIGEVVE